MADRYSQTDTLSAILRTLSEGRGGEIISWQRRRRACPVQSTEVAGVENDTVRCTVRRVDHSAAVRPYCPPDRQSTYCPRRTYTQSGYIIIMMYMLHIVLS